MNIYKLSGYPLDYDRYTDCVVIADNEEEARTIHPAERYFYKNGKWMYESADKGLIEANSSFWFDADEINLITVEFIGVANITQKKGVICASYHAG